MKGMDIWQALAGLGLFLFGMHLLEESVRNLAGRRFKKFIMNYTRSPLRGVFSGVVTTAILQSSSLVTLLVMSFTGSGILALKNGISVILGANLGTTFTGWLVSLLGFKLNLGAYVLPLIAVGGLGIVFLKKELPLNLCRFAMGFAFIFMGLNGIREGFETLTLNLDVSLLEGKPWLVFLLFGFALTAIIQSSSASIAIYLTALSSGWIDLPQAAVLVIGSDLGTTITSLLGIIKANVLKKKTGLAQVLFNVIQGALAILLLPVYLSGLNTFWPSGDPLIALVALQSFFNLTGIVCVLPFLGIFTQTLDRLVKDTNKNQTKYLSLTPPEESISGVEALRKELNRFAEKTLRTLRKLLDSEDTEAALISYHKLKSYENEISAYYLKLQNHPIHQEEAVKLNYLMASLRNMSLSAKDVKDILHNLEALKESADDLEYGLYVLIQEKQTSYIELLGNAFKTEAEYMETSLAKLDTEQDSMHAAYNAYLHRIEQNITRGKTVDYSSLLNLIRELENSNESMLRAYRNLCLAAL